MNPLNRQTALLCAACLFVSAIPDLAMAMTGSGDISTISTALEGLFEIMTGRTAKLLSTSAIVGSGYGLLAGRLAPAQAIYITLGSGVIFGAKPITQALGI